MLHVDLGRILQQIFVKISVIQSATVVTRVKISIKQSATVVTRGYESYHDYLKLKSFRFLEEYSQVESDV